jgi:DNA-binding MarR family transcriptional regulator
MTSMTPTGTRGDGSGRLPAPVPEPLRRVGDDFEDEYPGASALATECFANLYQTGNLLMDLHDRHTRERYQISPSARQVLAVVEGAGQPLEPSVIAERVLITTASMTSVLDTLERRGLIQRMPHPEDRRKLLVGITPAAQAVLDELLPSFHARERDVVSAALSTREQRELLGLIAKLQHAALQARSAPAPTATRQRPSRPSRDTSTVKGTQE